MYKNKLLRFSFWSIYLFALILTSCVSDSIDPEELGGVTTKESLVTLTVRVPQPSLPATTRSMTEAEESMVKTLQILSFDKDGYKSTHVATQMGEASKNVLKFSVKLPVGKQDLLILANSKQILDKVGFAKGTPLDEASKRLTQSLGVEKKWTNEAIPMSWVLMNQVISNDMNLGNAESPIKLLRMLSKVSLSLSKKAASGTENGTDNLNFKIREVLLYNTNTQGYIVPKVDANGELINKGFHIPTSTDEANPIKNRGPVKYEIGESNNDFNMNQVLNTIYTFEAEAGSQEDFINNTCLVIGGSYQNAEETSYYRLDFEGGNFIGEEEQNAVERAVNTEVRYRNLIRNHNYKINITEVSGPGFEDPEDALEAGAVNIECNVIAWNAAEMGDIVFDGQYFLGINPTQVTHFADALEDQVITITTDYLKYEPTIKVSTSATDPDKALVDEWLKLKPTSAGKPTESIAGTEAKLYKVPYDISLNTTGELRTAYVHISLGRLNTVVKVSQTADEALQVWVEVETEPNRWEEVEESEIYKLTHSHFFLLQSEDETEPVKPQNYRLRWKPQNAKLEFTSRAVDNPIVWESGYNPTPERSILTEETEGVSVVEIEGKEYPTKKFSIQPQRITNYKVGSFDSKQQKIEIRELGRDVLAKTILFSQQQKDIVIISKAQLLDGRESKSLSVKSNIPWQLKVTENVTDAEISAAPGKPVIKSLNDKTITASPSDFILSGTYNLPLGEVIRVKTYDDFLEVTTPPELYVGNLGLTVEEKDAESTPLSRTADILCASGIPQDGMEANCYVLDPTVGVGIFIPVQAANFEFKDKFHREGQEDDLAIPDPFDAPANLNIPHHDLSNFGAKLVWTDVQPVAAKIGESDLISMIKAIPSNKYILVLPGKVEKQGNAVVALTSEPEGKGDILWSWHIWVTSDLEFEGKPMQSRIKASGMQPNPSGGADITIWMDRNLGAIGKIPSYSTSFQPIDVKLLGNYYQWGRKDPFPGRNKFIYASADKKQALAYDAAGTGVMFRNSELSSISESIKKPTAIGSTAYNWHNLIDDNDRKSIFLWGKGEVGERKTIFDPCPAGYTIPNTRGDRTWQIEGTNNLWEEVKDEVQGISYWWYNHSVLLPQSGVWKRANSKMNNSYSPKTTNLVYWVKGKHFYHNSGVSLAYSGSKFEFSTKQVYQAYGYPVRCVLEDEL